MTLSGHIGSRAASSGGAMSAKLGFLTSSVLSIALAEPLFDPNDVRILGRMTIAFAIAFANQIPWNRLKEPRPSWERTLLESVITGFIAAAIVGVGLEYFPSVNLGIITFVGVLVGGMGITAFDFIRQLAAKLGLKSEKGVQDDRDHQKPS